MNGRLPLLVLGGLAVLFMVVVALQPQPLDWRPHYGRTSAKPYGAEVFFSLLPEWVGADVEVVDQPPYLALGDTLAPGSTYFFLTTRFAPDEAETHRLLQFAEKGGTVFVAATDFGREAFSDTLGLGPDSADAHGVDAGLDTAWQGWEDGRDSVLFLTGSTLQRAEGYRFPVPVAEWGIAGLDPARAVALAYDADSVVTLARIAVGDGAFLISSTPLAFTNAALVGEGDAAAFVGGVLGYLPSGTIWWDAYYKPFRAAQTPLRVVLRALPLRWAYGLILLGTALFVLFRGRRWQRPIPVVAPPANRLVGFVGTVGRLYHQHGDRRGLVARRRRAFLDRVRTRLGLAHADLSEETERRVVQRSGLSEGAVADLFARFRRLSRTGALSSQELLDLDQRLDAFYRVVGR